MIAAQGEDTSLWSVPCGFFPPTSPLASDAGLSAVTGKRDYDAVKKALEAAGYQGEKVVLMAPTDQPQNKAMSDVTADILKRVGMNVDYQATDWGSVVQRRSLTKPPAEGGWNLFVTGFSGLDFFTPGEPSAAARQRQGRMVRLAGRRRRSRTCARPGSTRRTWTRRRRSALKSSSRRSRACRTIRSGWRNFRRRSATTSPACRRGS